MVSVFLHCLQYNVDERHILAEAPIIPHYETYIPEVSRHWAHQKSIQQVLHAHNHGQGPMAWLGTVDAEQQ